jgi:hypothetical protein
LALDLEIESETSHYYINFCYSVMAEVPTAPDSTSGHYTMAPVTAPDRHCDRQYPRAEGGLTQYILSKKINRIDHFTVTVCAAIPRGMSVQDYQEDKDKSVTFDALTRQPQLSCLDKCHY